MLILKYMMFLASLMVISFSSIFAVKILFHWKTFCTYPQFLKKKKEIGLRPYLMLFMMDSS